MSMLSHFVDIDNISISISRAVGFEFETKRLFCNRVGNITALEINISHIRYAAPCVASGTGGREPVSAVK